MMQVWHFSEMAYHPAWPQLGDTYRVTIPIRLFDPKIGADLYHRYLDEWALCDELGINIMTNEHHATATCAELGVHDPDGDPGARDQEGAAPRARHADRQPQRPDPRRRGIFDAST